MGGVGPLYARYPAMLPQALSALQLTLVSPDESLARNGATTLQRWAEGGGALCGALLGVHGAWLGGVVQLYHTRRAMQEQGQGQQGEWLAGGGGGR